MPLPAVDLKIAPLASERGDELRPSRPSTHVARPTLGVYWRTLRHLGGAQLGYLAARRFWARSSRPRRLAGPVTLVKLARVPDSAAWREWRPAVAREMIRTRRFDFLHMANPPGGAIPWSPDTSSSAEYPRLWRYHLNYCDFLNVDLTRPGDEPDLRAALAITLDWLERNRAGSEVGWEPYPLSLRIVNWLKFVLRNRAAIEALGDGQALDLIIRSTAEQAATLERRLEYGLGANHLIKNIKALLFAGALLETTKSGEWWSTGSRLLERELREQILPDGGHFERSPMYHLQVLEDLLDLRALAVASGRSLDGALLPERIAAMAAFARAILHPDGEIPLFNDSAFDIGRPTQELLALAADSPAWERRHPARIPGSRRDDHALTKGGSAGSSPSVAVLTETGYAVIRDPNSESALIFDCGPLGPDYNPGHGHCDVLSYELSLYGHRVVVDTGVSSYERGPERQYERSTAAHNTLRVDGEDQAEIWASFRVGRRPRVDPIEAEEVAGLEIVRGRHFGYQHRGLVHSRAVIHTAGNAWVIVDSLLQRMPSGRPRISRWRDDHAIESFIHFHPSVALTPVAPDDPSGAPDAETLRTRWTLEFGGHRVQLATLGPGDLALEETTYSPEFGLRQPRPTVRWTTRATTPMMIHAFVPEGESVSIVRLPEGGVEIEGVPVFLGMILTKDLPLLAQVGGEHR